MYDATYSQMWRHKCNADPACKERLRSASTRWQEKCHEDPSCKERKSQADKIVAQRAKDSHRCRNCREPVQPGHTLCDRHLAYLRLYNWLRKCYAVDLLGGKCSVCGQTDIRILDFDHKNNDGSQHRRDLFGSPNKSGSMRDWIIKHPEEAKERLQVLCANCHAYKRYEREMVS